MKASSEERDNLAEKALTLSHEAEARENRSGLMTFYAAVYAGLSVRETRFRQPFHKQGV